MVTTRASAKSKAHNAAKDESKSKAHATEEHKQAGASMEAKQSQKPGPRPKGAEKGLPKADPHSTPTAQGNGDGGGQSAIVEKGIIYFLSRARVDTDDPHGTGDLQRSFLVLRPLRSDAEMNGVQPDEPVTRVIVLPKKTLPRSSRDRFMVFVEHANSTMARLKETFFKGTESDTKTRGTRTTPPVTPVGEGVYVITCAKNKSHLAYMLAIPQELGEVQRDLGICERGSFVLSFKNPKIGGPAHARLGKEPKLPGDLSAKFRGRRWMPVDEARVLDYENVQLLLIGEGQGELRGAVETESNREESVKAELEELEEEEEHRVQDMDGEDSIFKDLRISKDVYPALKSTW
jgi:uroporphyrinogen-III synthase